MLENSITKQQSYFVVKSNEIIQKSRFSMSVQQQKIMLFLISKIKPTDTANQLYCISILDFLNVTDMCDSGNNYSEVKKALKTIADKSMWLTKPNGKEVLLRWLDRIEIDTKTNLISVRFHEDMFPYLLDLREKYTQYSLENILPMRSKYGIRLYELLRSYANMDSAMTIEIDELRQRMDCTQYERFPDFRRFALNPALDDINTFTDISVECSFQGGKGRGHACKEITFLIDAH